MTNGMYVMYIIRLHNYRLKIVLYPSNYHFDEKENAFYSNLKKKTLRMKLKIIEIIEIHISH